MKMSFPNPDDILNFTLTIEPDEGMYKGGSFHFTFAINQNFPHDPPKVKCTQKIYHPNIDLEGNVCLNILREDWKPVLNLNAVIVGMQVCLSPFLPSNHSDRWPLHFVGEQTADIFGRHIVPLPRTQCLRSPQQGSSRRSPYEQGRLQAQRANLHGRRYRQGSTF
jgi:ubiquitin-conjugating enzyme E2 M